VRENIKNLTSQRTSKMDEGRTETVCQLGYVQNAAQNTPADVVGQLVQTAVHQKKSTKRKHNYTSWMKGAE
jgi:transcriptional accessory protein Tex/SPT6